MTRRAKCSIPAMLFVVPIGMACGGRSELANYEGNAPPGAGRVVTIFDGSTLRIVSFDDAMRPQVRSFPASSADADSIVPYQYSDWSPDGKSFLFWSFSSSRLGESLVQLASAPDWQPSLELGPRYGPNGVYISHTWLGSEAILEFGPTRWSWISRDGQRLSGTLNEDHVGFLDPYRRSAIVATHEGFTWLGPKGKLGDFPAESRNWNFTFAEDGRGAVAALEGEDVSSTSTDDGYWMVRSTRIDGCSQLEEDDRSCFPKVRRVLAIPGSTDEVILVTQLEGASRKMLVQATWGEKLELKWPVEPGALRVLWEGDEDAYFYEQFVGRRLWIFSGDPIDTLNLVEFDEFDQAEPPQAFRFPAREKNSLGTIVGGRWLSPRASAIGEAVQWDVLDLTKSLPTEWFPTPYVGEIASGLGHKGLLFYDLRADPNVINRPCEPCSFFAVQDVNDPNGNTIQGTFVSDGSPLELGFNVLSPTPDDSGVLVREAGVLFYETFAEPGVRFPLAPVDDDAYISLPPTWGGD